MSVQFTEQFKNYLGKKDNKLSPKSVQAVLELSAEGNTVPFMARYRKERTGNLDEVQIRLILDSFQEWNELVKRKEFVLNEIEKQGNLTAELKASIEKSQDLAEIEEIYRPYKKKKKTKATLAREAGLEPLANWIWAIGHGEDKDTTSVEVKAKEFINATAGYATYEEVLRGAQHIIVEKLSNIPSLRQLVRDEYKNNGRLVSEKAAGFKPHSKFEMYAQYSEPLKNLLQRKASHRYLAVRRGWQEEELKVTLQADDEKLLKAFVNEAMTVGAANVAGFLETSAKTALTVHVLPSIGNELHTELKEKADQDAIYVFAENVRRVLMASPFGAKTVLGIDPGLRTGCKVALIDKNGHFVSHTVVHTVGDDAKEKAKKLFEDVFKKLKIDAVAVGNGTGGREAESFFRAILKELGVETPVIMISEAGASVYSASEVARAEFPDLDVTVKGAISIARRLQDPLAELVKVEPKSIGVGQYQHDVAQTPLKKSLHEVVESCVNNVGVDLNTASTSLLQYVSGIGPAIAANIVNYRKDKGLFQEREELLKVPQFSTKAYEQAAGFLRIMGGKISLDATGVHPERYSAIREMAQEAGLSIGQLLGPGAQQLKPLREKWSKLIGEFTFDDILRELEKPGRDPRDPFKVFQYREDIHEIKDLKEGMICPGIVTNVTNFGAFVDIGVHQDGLVHISELSDKFVEDPRTIVSPGDQVQVKVLGVDMERSQVSLTMKLEDRPRVEQRSEQPREPRQQGDRPRQQGDRPRGGGQGGGQRPQQQQARGTQGPQNRGGQQRDGGPRRDDQRGGPRGGGQGPRGGGDRQPRPAGKPFNNPFAALTTTNNKK